MQPEYTDYDTERVRQAGQAASIGTKTRQLHELPPMPDTMAPAVAAPAVAAPAGTRPWYGPALVVTGMLMLLTQLGSSRIDLEGGMIMLTISSFFMFFAFWKRIYGLFIPGSILAGLSLGITFADVSDGVSVVWGLALGFLMIFLGGNVLYNQRSQWPLYPAAILFMVGCLVAVTAMPSFLVGGMIWLPLLLMGLGLYLGWGRRSA